MANVIQFKRGNDSARGSLSTPADGEPIYVKDTNKLFIGDGTTAADSLSALGGDISLANGSDNRVVTATGSAALNGEANLTFDGSTLAVTGDATVSDNLGLVSDDAELTFGANSEVKLIHKHNEGLILKHTATADDKPVSLILQTGETDIAADDVLGKLSFQAPDEGTGTDAILVAAEIAAISEGDFSSSSNATKMVFRTGSSAAAADRMTLSSGGNLNVTGTITGTGTSVFADLDISGDVDVDGTLEADAITLGGTSLASSATTDTTNADNIGSGTLAAARMAAAQTAITSILATDVKIGEDDQTKIDFETANKIHFYADNAKQVVIQDGAILPGTDNDIDLGASGTEFKDAFFDGTVTTDALVVQGNTTVQNILAGTTANTIQFEGASGTEFKDAFFDGTVTTDALVVGGNTTVQNILAGTTANTIQFEGSTADDHETTLGVIDPTGDRTINLPNVSGTIPVLAAASTTQISATPAELNVLDGITATVSELNILDGVTATASELNIMDGVTATTSELNIMDGVTATTSELNIMDGVTATAAEINLIDGGTSRGTTAVANGDGFLHNDNGTMRMTNVSKMADLFAGTGIDASSAVLSVAAAQTGITSVFATDLKLGEDDETKIDFETANQIHFYLNNAKDFSMTANTFTAESGSSIVVPAGGLTIGSTAVSATAAELNIMDGVTASTSELNIMDGVTATTSELNIMDGVTSTTADLNLMDGGTSATSTTLASADRFVCNDNGTMKQVALSDLVTYLEDGGTSGFNVDGGTYS